MVVFGQSGCVRVKVVVFGKIGFIPAKWFYSGKSGCNRANWLYSVKSCIILAKPVVFGQGGCIRTK